MERINRQQDELEQSPEVASKETINKVESVSSEMTTATDGAANDNSEVFPPHLEHLDASGLSVETIKALGIRSVDSNEARIRLGWPEDKKGDPAGILFPYPAIPGYAKVRPDKPRLVGEAEYEKSVKKVWTRDLCGEPVTIDDGPLPRPIKYEAPLGSDPHCYIPLPICPKLKDPEERLYLTEGEKKAALMCQQDQPCIALPGVSSGHDVEHRREAQDWGGTEFVLHPELKPYVLPGREVVILFDTPDMEVNREVIRSAVRTARMLDRAGARVLVGFVPPVRGLEKTGVDDFFVDTLKHMRTNGIIQEYNPLAADFADARPVAPNELLGWLQQMKSERGWVAKELRIELRRAAIWTRIWYERDNRSFKGWTRRAAKEVYVPEEEINSMVNHLPSQERSGAGNGEPNYKNFGDGAILAHCVPGLNEHFLLLRAPDGNERVFGVNGRNEVTLKLNETHLEQAVHDALKSKFGEVPPKRVVTRAIELWKLECERITEEPAPFCFQGDAYCFKRFDWAPTPGEFPAWEEFLARLSDREAFMAFVWSCFEPKNVSRQYLWLRGNGQDGKSSVLNAITEVFGPAATAINNASIKEARFVASSIYGKRLVVYPDCKNSKFGMMELVRNWTSGDVVPVEFKGKTAFAVPMRVKLLVASNPKPQITGQTADASRMIWVEVADSTNRNDPTWPQRLGSELPAFLFACREAYERACPNHGDIELGERSRDLRDQAVASFEERYHETFDANFEVAVGKKTQANRVSRRLREVGLNNNEVADFKAWMERTHGVRFGRTKAERYYENVVVVNGIDALVG